MFTGEVVISFDCLDSLGEAQMYVANRIDEIVKKAMGNPCQIYDKLGLGVNLGSFTEL